ncbi:ATP-dependent RNA helicase DDX19B [Trichinella spiralis]|uniref:ATP-dependent RNA helicase DDX19B n=1 Tax=Trichinella spiralis TaxID=6334 RepID=UPI0001EFC459|nr:ATP-dependent RNA helicase DDX19B [Trichinella spiralis]
MNLSNIKIELGRRAVVTESTNAKSSAVRRAPGLLLVKTDPARNTLTNSILRRHITRPSTLSAKLTHAEQQRGDPFENGNLQRSCRLIVPAYNVFTARFPQASSSKVLYLSKAQIGRKLAAPSDSSILERIKRRQPVKKKRGRSKKVRAQPPSLAADQMQSIVMEANDDEDEKVQMCQYPGNECGLPAFGSVGLCINHAPPDPQYGLMQCRYPMDSSKLRCPKSISLLHSQTGLCEQHEEVILHMELDKRKDARRKNARYIADKELESFMEYLKKPKRNVKRKQDTSPLNNTFSSMDESSETESEPEMEIMKTSLPVPDLPYHCLLEDDGPFRRVQILTRKEINPMVRDYHIQYENTLLELAAALTMKYQLRMVQSGWQGQDAYVEKKQHLFKKCTFPKCTVSAVVTEKYCAEHALITRLKSPNRELTRDGIKAALEKNDEELLQKLKDFGLGSDFLCTEQSKKEEEEVEKLKNTFFFISFPEVNLTGLPVTVTHVEVSFHDAPFLQGDHDCSSLAGWQPHPLTNGSYTVPVALTSDGRHLVNEKDPLELAPHFTDRVFSVLVRGVGTDVAVCANWLDDAQIYLGRFYGSQVAGPVYVFSLQRHRRIQLLSLLVNGENSETQVGWSIRRKWWPDTRNGREPSDSSCRLSAEKAPLWFHSTDDRQLLQPDTEPRLVTVDNVQHHLSELTNSVLVIRRADSDHAWRQSTTLACASLSPVAVYDGLDFTLPDDDRIEIRQQSPFHPLTLTRTSTTRKAEQKTTASIFVPLDLDNKNQCESEITEKSKLNLINQQNSTVQIALDVTLYGDRSIMFHKLEIQTAGAEPACYTLQPANVRTAVARFFYPALGVVKFHQLDDHWQSTTWIVPDVQMLFDLTAPEKAVWEISEKSTGWSQEEMACSADRDLFDPAKLGSDYCLKAAESCPIGSLNEKYGELFFTGQRDQLLGLGIYATELLPLNGPFSIIGNTLSLNFDFASACANITLTDETTTSCFSRNRTATDSKVKPVILTAHFDSSHLHGEITMEYEEMVAVILDTNDLSACNSEQSVYNPFYIRISQSMFILYYSFFYSTKSAIDMCQEDILPILSKHLQLEMHEVDVQVRHVAVKYSNCEHYTVFVADNKNNNAISNFLSPSRWSHFGSLLQKLRPHECVIASSSSALRMGWFWGN